ncbi:MAG: hypothetical protein IT542_04980 [Rubellimicrobium sp.]|nr:hypothetical protein [Rubellimicrobium sp.]
MAGTSACRRRGRARLAAALCLLATTLPAILPAATLTIRDDPGGSLAERLALIERYRAAGTALRIEGSCISACTLYLGLPGTCVTRGARLGFHGPRTGLPGIPLPRAEFERLTRVMAAHYPPAIRDWFMTEARLTTTGYHVLSGVQAVAMGAQAC